MEIKKHLEKMDSMNDLLASSGLFLFMYSRFVCSSRSRLLTQPRRLLPTVATRALHAAAFTQVGTETA